MLTYIKIQQDFLSIQMGDDGFLETIGTIIKKEETPKDGARATLILQR